MAHRKTGIHRNRLKSLFREMVDIYSPSGKEEEIVEFLASYLHDKDLPVTLREVSEGRRNVEVVFKNAIPRVAFIGHVDTVPAFDIDDYESQESEGRIWGLGTADMKSGCAAMIEAFVSLVEQDIIPRQAGLYLVVGEEESGDGTEALLAARSFEWALVAEPTDLIPCLGHYGYMEMLVRAFGKRRHASMACHEYNAIMGMLKMLIKVVEDIETEHPDVILNIRDIHSSEAGFAVPGSCEAFMDLHLPPPVAPAGLARELKSLVKKCLENNKLSNYEIEFPLKAGGYQLNDNGLLPEALRKVYAGQNLDWNPGAFKSHSDANLLWEAQCKPIILGPGQLAMAHTRDESVDFEQVISAAEIYRDLLITLME